MGVLGVDEAEATTFPDYHARLPEDAAPVGRSLRIAVPEGWRYGLDTTGGQMMVNRMAAAAAAAARGVRTRLDCRVGERSHRRRRGVALALTIPDLLDRLLPACEIGVAPGACELVEALDAGAQALDEVVGQRVAAGLGAQPSKPLRQYRVRRPRVSRSGTAPGLAGRSGQPSPSATSLLAARCTSRRGGRRGRSSPKRRCGPYASERRLEQCVCVSTGPSGRRWPSRFCAKSTSANTGRRKASALTLVAGAATISVARIDRQELTPQDALAIVQTSSHSALQSRVTRRPAHVEV
jgi:hypothetical protein